MDLEISPIKKSFTLVELLITIVIIGIIMTFAIPQYRKAVIRARAPEAKQNLRILAESVWRYYTEAGEFPPNAPFGAKDIPTCLDITLPEDASKYYTYYYENGPPWAPSPYVYLLALDMDAWDNGPYGVIIQYSIS